MISLLHETVSRQAETRPDATAVVMDGQQLTYGELEASSNRLARLLRDTGCRRGDRVGLLIPKSPEAVLAMFGAMKADCTYVPIDVASPATRVEKILRSCEPAALIVSAAAHALVDDLLAGGHIPPGVVIGSLGPDRGGGRNFTAAFARPDLERYEEGLPPIAASSADPVHILFTSGSTGTPKGVVITHSNVIHFIDWAVRYFGTVPSDRISGHPPLHFDLSTFDIYGTLLAGAELHLVPPSLNLLARELAEFIRRNELTQWFSVPSTLSYLRKFDAVGWNDFPSLRRVLWCGEVLPTPVLRYWMQRVPHASFTNLYGPTEATIASSFFTVATCPPSDTDDIPIGRPCPGEELLVLDQELRPVPRDEIADLYIAGAGLSPGYWRDEQKTKEAFLPDPRLPGDGRRIYRTGDLATNGAGGLFHFVGRRDTQVKSRGYRIELGEIESALNTLAGLKDCAVVAVETGGFEGVAICCAYATDVEAPVPPTQVRKELGGLLPPYMIPSQWITTDALPKNVNGKTDRRALKEMFASRLRPQPVGAARAEKGLGG